MFRMPFSYGNPSSRAGSSTQREVTGLGREVGELKGGEGDAEENFPQ